MPRNINTIDIENQEVIFKLNKDNEINKEDDSHKRFVMCPTPSCDQKLIGTWKDYDTGEKRNGLSIYKCPNCGNTFTVNDFKINAVEIPNLDGIAVIYDTARRKIISKIPGETRFIDSQGIAYINIPIIHAIAPNSIMVYLTDIKVDDFTDDEIISVVKQHIAETHKRK